MTRDLADLVDVSRRTAAAARRRVDGHPRNPAQVLADIEPVQARLADLAAATIATASQAKRLISEVTRGTARPIDRPRRRRYAAA